MIESNSSLSPGPYEKSIYIVQSHAPLPCLHTYIQGENPCNRLFLGTLPRWSPVSILPHVKLGPSLCHPPGKESCEGLLNLCEFSLYLSTPLPGILLSLPAQQWGHRHTLPHLAFLYMCQGFELRLSYVCTQQAPSTQLDPHQPRPPFPHGVASFPLQICSDPGLTPSYLRDDEQIRVNSIFPLFQENNMSTTKAPINQ